MLEYNIDLTGKTILVMGAQAARGVTVILV